MHQSLNLNGTDLVTSLTCERDLTLYCDAGMIWLTAGKADLLISAGQQVDLERGQRVVIQSLEPCRLRMESPRVSLQRLGQMWRTLWHTLNKRQAAMQTAN
ncbi:DUF2917 domain-containing protein [Chitinibacteraceae bacterium HSL-7]